MPIQNVALASPLHDPEGKILDLINKNGRKLLQIYHEKAAVCVSETTIPSVIEKLKSIGFKVEIQEGTNLADNYRLAIKTALEFETPYVHQIDFDRALHWANRFPGELKDVLTYFPSYSGFISFMRTHRAFETHPEIQRTVETTVNAIASEVVKVDVDIMSGSFGFDRKLATYIVSESKRRDFGIYAEFLTIAQKHKSQINVIEVEGLEWETPDQFKEVIEKEGYAKWLEDFQSLPEWKKRIKLVEDSTDELI